MAPARVPSCLLTGITLHNFALNDLAGRPWEYRNHTGRLVLLNFWSTTQLPCLETLPRLNILHDRYRYAGLEIVGIAYEEGELLRQIQNVDNVRKRLNVEYRLLIGGDRKQCPVRIQFGVPRVPTLVLLDESGKIIWRTEVSGPRSFRRTRSHRPSTAHAQVVHGPGERRGVSRRVELRVGSDAHCSSAIFTRRACASTLARLASPTDLLV